MKQISHGTFTKPCYLSHSSPGIFCRLERAPRRPQRLVRKFLQRLSGNGNSQELTNGSHMYLAHRIQVIFAYTMFLPISMGQVSVKVQTLRMFFATYGWFPAVVSVVSSPSTISTTLW